MAALLMDVSSIHLAGKNLGKLFTDGQKQASSEYASSFIMSAIKMASGLFFLCFNVQSAF